MRHLVLSVDYEIFGNGDGDVMQHVVHPAAAMVDCCEQFGAPLTVFFEVEEYLAFVQFAEALSKILGYDPAARIREQITDLAHRGHDVQLHLHPEWYGARFEDGRWMLNPRQRAVDDLFDTQAETDRYIASRKAVIEELVPDRKVVAYRAGAFCAQPGTKLLSALATNGFLIDTSVVKGLQDAQAQLDYRDAPSFKGPWRIRHEVAREDSKGPLWEFPIYAVAGRRFQQATIARLRAKFSRNVPATRQKEMVGQLGLKGSNPLKVMRFLCQPVPLKLDYHNISAGKLMQWIRSAPATGEPDVLMLIGHTKEHIDCRTLEKLLKTISREPDVTVISLENLAGMLETKGANFAAAK
jgi:hypothetical protein